MNSSRILISISFALALGCSGSSTSQVVPGLPGDGTSNLSPTRSSLADSEPELDLWEGKELIEPPKALSPRALTLPKIERFTLKNGLKVIAVQDSALPVTTFQLAARVGKQDSDRKMIGLAEFASQTMLRGTRSRKASRLAQEIEAVGGSLHASASLEATFFSCKSLSKDQKTCLSVLPDVLTSPIFPKEEIEIVRRNLHASVRQRRDDASALASAHFHSALWGDDHVRGWIMSDSTIDAITRDHMVSWHQNWIRPNNAVLAVAGNFDNKTIKAQLEKSFGRWKRGKVPARSTSKPPKLNGLKIRLVDKPGQTQSHLRLGHFGLAHNDDDLYATAIFNHSLGGGQFSSRLMKVLRSAEGKTYTASSRFDRNREKGAFVASTFTRSAETVATIKLMMQVLGTMAKEGPTDEERNAAVTNIAGRYATRFETAAAFGSALLAAELHGFGDEYVSQYPLKIGGVSRERAAAAASRILDPVNMILVVVGDAKVVGPQLKASGWTYELVSHTAPVSNWERAASESESQEADDPQAVAKAKKLLDEALVAKGGSKRMKKLAHFQWSGEASLNLPTGKMGAQVEKRYVTPNKLRLDMEVGGQVKITTVLRGESGWAQEEGPRGRGVRAFSKLELQALQNQLWRDADLVLLRYLEKSAQLSLLGSRTIDGTVVSAVRVADKAASRSVTLLVDSKTKLLLGIDYTDMGVTTSERFSDYKKVNGLQVAHTRTTKNAQMDMTVTLKSFNAQKAIAESLFVEPPGTESPPKENK
jgi:predicted Zn-dependent peptidase